MEFNEKETCSLVQDLLNYLCLNGRNYDGKQMLLEMKNKNMKGYRQLEYQGFYFQQKIANFLAKNYGYKTDFFKNGRSIIDTFDTKYNIPIDIKTHNVSKGNTIILNDKETIDKAIEKYGAFGLIVLDMDCKIDEDYSLRNFQKSLDSTYVSKMTKTVKYNRKIKSSFSIKDIRFIVFEDNGCFQIFNQGINSDGSSRKPKYNYTLLNE